LAVLLKNKRLEIKNIQNIKRGICYEKKKLFWWDMFITIILIVLLKDIVTNSANKYQSNE